MKIQCDVCNKEEASLYCTADEAALCNTCDHRVHHANKLASKHPRFSLLHPSKQLPICDICQGKRAFLFCQQDRAILCRDCDVSIHSTNEHTLKHNRFLLTGVKLSSTSAPDSSNGDDSVPEFKSQPLINKNNHGDSSSMSSISEYIETLPGWHVEDFLDSSSPPPSAFCKSDDDDAMLPFLDTEVGNLSGFSQESLDLWVPQSPSSLYDPPPPPQLEMKANNKRRWSDDELTVPQINTQSIGSKRCSRQLL